LDWLNLAKVGSGPFELRNVAIQDVNTWAVLSTANSIMVSVPSEIQTALDSHLSLAQSVVEISERMREGVRPESFAFANESSLATNLVLIHGYCSPVNPWQQSASDFTSPQFFLNPSASVSNDEYAQLLVKWSGNLGAFSAIGHSQGGPVLAHLKNYYWSGLDQLKGTTGRVLQTVGAPYQGNSAAGSLANIGQLFGIGCGTNADLTVDGAKLWLAGVTAATKAQIFFYSTTYKLNQILGDYCNLAINLILSWPNDGMAEFKYVTLPGGNDQGSLQGWCHSEGMKYTAQFLDHSRNAQLNSLARR